MMERANWIKSNDNKIRTNWAIKSLNYTVIAGIQGTLTALAVSCRLPPAAGSVNYSCTTNTHRGHHVNVVLSAVQECDYVAGRSCNTQSGIIDAGHRRHCAGSRGCSLQDEGSEVENQCEEMVEHVLEIEGGGKIQPKQKQTGTKVVWQCLNFVGEMLKGLGALEATNEFLSQFQHAIWPHGSLCNVTGKHNRVSEKDDLHK